MIRIIVAAALGFFFGTFSGIVLASLCVAAKGMEDEDRCQGCRDHRGAQGGQINHVPYVDAHGFIKCSYCQSVLRKTDRYCHECGKKIDWSEGNERE